ncbi:MAG: FAD-dependent oxidoreductase [Lentisphaerae bacterium]|nr:FAD-dependent oxidoreductase [Lentisphaerota bacterium]
MNFDKYDVVIIGGGFFRLYIGEYFALQKKRVLICEKNSECMLRASYNNQARVHSGYHYPRSLLTAQRSCASFPRFVKEFPEAVEKDFDKYYAIGRILGKVTATQFYEFCNRIDAPCETASDRVKKLFDEHYIEEVFRCREYVFNAKTLRTLIQNRYLSAGGELALNCEVKKIQKMPSGFGVSGSLEGRDFNIVSDEVFNCTYSHINFINAHSDIELIPLKHEMTEMALVEVPPELEGMGITVMCGPFFSLMPFPDRNLYTLSHVRYTPHYEWYDTDKSHYISAHHVFDADPKLSAYTHILKDSMRYLPCLRGCRYKSSLWEVKTILPASEVSDSRPILFKANYGMKGYHCVMGGKIDNVYDAIQSIGSI